jgi:hypothetical protein
MKRIIILGIIGLMAAGMALAQLSKPQDRWTPLAFLLGEWEGLGTGAPGEAVGGTSFAFDLDRNILVRKNWAKYPPKPGEAAGVSHEDLMIIYAPGDHPSARAVYFDNEGHVIEYAVVASPKTDAAVFESDLSRPGPHFRLTYELKADGTLENLFWVAAPGGEFKTYTRGLLKRKKER